MQMHSTTGSDNMEARPRSSKAEDELSFNDMFSLRKPRDARAGLSSGGKSAAKGVLMGVLGLVLAPIAGGVQDGFIGFGKGVVTGKLSDCLHLHW